MDYATPHATDFPEPAAMFYEVPSTQNPLGVKGCGEAGVTGSIPAIANATADALARAGARGVIQMPFTSEKVWRAIRSGGVDATRSAATHHAHATLSRP